MPLILFGNNQMAVLCCSGVTCISSNVSASFLWLSVLEGALTFYMCMKELTLNIPITVLL